MTSPQGADTPKTTPEARSSDRGRLRGIDYWIVLALGALGLLMAINQTFNLKFLGFQPLGNSYLYYLIGIFLAAAFLCFPAWSGARNRISWYDWVLSGSALVSCGYLGYHGLTMINMGWEYFAPTEATIFSGILVVLVLEGVRRCGGGRCWPCRYSLAAIRYMQTVCPAFSGAISMSYRSFFVPTSLAWKVLSVFPCRWLRSWSLASWCLAPCSPLPAEAASS